MYRSCGCIALPIIAVYNNRFIRIGPFHPIKILFPFISNITIDTQYNILQRLLNILKRLNQAFTRTTHWAL